MNDLQNIKKTGISLLIILISFSLKAKTTPLDSIPSTSASLLALYDMYEECDVCGCGSSGGGMGYGTIGDSNFIGVRYINQQYRSRDGIYNNSPWIDEHFNTMQLWSQVPLGERFSVNTIVPLHFHSRALVDGSDQEISGLGDVNILASYNLIQTKDTPFVPDENAIKHSLSIGAGLKLPTGSYNRENNTGSVNPSFQLGTGSWDILLASNYSVGYKQYGMGVLANYVIKTENNEQYQFGNQFNYGVNFFRRFENLRMQSYIPVIGLAGEVFGENQSYGIAVQDTKGNVLFGRLGFEADLGIFNTGINVMLPVAQNLNDGNVEAKSRIGVHFNYKI